MEISQATAEDLPHLFEVWESSVRATHDFLGEQDIQDLIPLVQAGLKSFEPIFCLRNEAGIPYAFLGVEGPKIEMLFVRAQWRHQGAGSLLTRFAMESLGATQVDVNEQNPQAIGFYQHFGFLQTGRSPLDSSGNPFPILHLTLGPPRPGEDPDDREGP